MFYGFLVVTIVLYMTGHKVPGNIMMALFLGIPILMFVFKEPLGNLVKHNHKKIEGGKGMFFVQDSLNCSRRCSVISQTHCPMYVSVHLQ